MVRRSKLATGVDPNENAPRISLPTSVRSLGFRPKTPPCCQFPGSDSAQEGDASAPEARATVLVEPGIEARVQGHSWDNAGASAGPDDPARLR